MSKNEQINNKNNNNNNSNHNNKNNNNNNHNNNNNSNPKDMFSVCQQSFDKFFNTIRQSVPQYHQSVTNVQQEYLQACENLVNSTVSLQKEFTRKSGINTVVPDAATKLVRDSSEEVVKTSSINNQIVLATIDATQQNIKTFNDNAKSFAELNKNILQSWISAFAVKSNN